MPQLIISLVCLTVPPLTGHTPLNIRDDSSSDSEELSAQTPLLATATGVSLGKQPMSSLAPPVTTSIQVPSGPPATSNVKEYDTMFNKEPSTDEGDGNDGIPVGTTARDYTELYV